MSIWLNDHNRKSSKIMSSFVGASANVAGVTQAYALVKCWRTWDGRHAHSVAGKASGGNINVGGRPRYQGPRHYGTGVHGGSSGRNCRTLRARPAGTGVL